VNHRRDIEGLRGIAVLLVIAYHANPGLLPGGYVGVDVFFAISGFLITALLVRGSAVTGSSLGGFYERRIRRILPALTLMLAASLAAGCFILGPHDLKQLAKAAVAVTFMGGNFFFWHQRDYFADQAPPHALLHTWSIGVEEQYYLLFPFFVFALRRHEDRMRTWMWAGIAASLTLSYWVTHYHPAASFYLLPTRAWEFLIGGVLALSPVPQSTRSARVQLSAAAGLIALLMSAASFSGTTPYPGVAATLPVLGTVLLI
jgi:peptidoglycan/LPS O-acetylase OafA/YrhL